ncbi:MAG: hypothetical protein IKV59_07505 [Lachnospiraceae bacterium]|nr:hypothetical protein [Lachnospiraceae bacterium]
MNENYYNEEVEIDLIDMMFYLLKKWKSLVVAIVLGAILGGAIYMVKKPEPVVTPTPAQTEEKIVSLEESYYVNPDVRAQMDVAIRYRQLYNQQLEYSQKSLIMQMDPGAVYTGELEYYISAGENTRLLGERFYNILTEERLLTELKEAIGVDCEEQYLNEIISGSIGLDGTSNITVDNQNADLVRNSVIAYRVSYMDQQSCQAMLDVIAKHVEALNEEFQDTYGSYEFEKVNNSVRLIINNDYLNKQKSCADAINSYLNSIKNLENSFAEDDREYYNIVYLGREQAKKPVETPVVVETQDPVKEMVKWLVIGILLLCVCWGGYYLMVYLLDSHVRSASELQQRYGLQILGRVDQTGAEEKGINGWLNRMDRKRKGKADSVEYIAAAIDALQVQKLQLCLNQNHAAAKGLADELVKECNNLAVGNMIHLDSESLEKAKQMDGIILLAVAGDTEQKQIRRDLDVCRMQKIPVMGVIVVE